MLTEVADGVLVHESEFIQSNSTVVRGRDGLLLIDPGITERELTDLADDLRSLGQPVAAGFSTHPDWDHVLWHARFGDAPRYSTARGAASIREFLSQPEWREEILPALPPEYIGEIPLELLGDLTPLPGDATYLTWNGPRVRILEHRAHATGHAALLVEDSRVLVAGDMLSDILMPFLDLDADDPLEDYLAALRLFDSVADGVDVVIPGHGSVGGKSELRARIDQDRAYVEALRGGGNIDDSRVGPDAPLDWLPDIHDWQRERVFEKRRAQGQEAE